MGGGWTENRRGKVGVVQGENNDKNSELQANHLDVVYFQCGLWFCMGNEGDFETRRGKNHNGTGQSLVAMMRTGRPKVERCCNP